MTQVGLAVVGLVLIPGGVALFTMRRHIDALQQKVKDLEVRAERQGAELEGTRSALHGLQITVSTGFARLEVMLTHHKEPA